MNIYKGFLYEKSIKRRRQRTEKIERSHLQTIVQPSIVSNQRRKKDAWVSAEDRVYQKLFHIFDDGSIHSVWMHPKWFLRHAVCNIPMCVTSRTRYERIMGKIMGKDFRQNHKENRRRYCSLLKNYQRCFYQYRRKTWHQSNCVFVVEKCFFAHKVNFGAKCGFRCKMSSLYVRRIYVEDVVEMGWVWEL